MSGAFRLPNRIPVALQAVVSEPIKPCMDVVIMATVHANMTSLIREMVIGGGH